MMELYPKNRISLNEIKKFIVIFYSVGLLGFIIPLTRDVFKIITPFALLLCVYLLAIFSQDFNKKGAIALILIYFFGLFAEIIGVNTGNIFGNYYYGSSLGPKVWGTPLLIGINWIFLAYTTASIVDDIFSISWLTLFLAPSIMVGYDFILERAASIMDMWYWEQGYAQLRNYISWYVLGFMMISLIKIADIKTKNPLSGILLLSQFLFLLLVSLLIK